MEYYFSDRSYNIIGMASTTLKDAIRIYDDLEAEDIDSGLSSFEGKIYFTDDKDGNIDVVTEMCQKGNYILYRNRLEKDRFFTIIETEKDRKENSISFYAEDGGLDLINEVVGPFESTTAQPASFYLEEFLKDSGFTIGLNEIVNLSRKLKWEGESSVTSRIRSVATQFDNAEISFSFEIEGMVVSEKKVNIHKKRGNETNETLTLGKEIDNIKTIESIENLATSLLPKGGTPEGENAVPIDLKGYVYDDGRFYVNKDGFIRDREARTIWNRFSTTPSDDTGFINKPFSYDTLSKSELLNRAIGKLKEISKPDQNFIVDIITLPDNVSLGDRINIVDERDDLNLSTRVLKLEIEEGINKCTALLGEFIIKQKTIGEKLQDIADNLKDNMKPGDTYYPSVAYADDDEGNGFSISPDNKAYIAIIHQKNNSIPSTNPKDYEGQWIHIKGLNGDRGEDGLPGKDGVGLKSTTITYAYNKSSLNPPTSGWTSDVPQTPPGDYLWTRTIWKYTDNKEETGYSVSRIGKDGNTGNDGIAGKDGVGLKSTSVNYASSSSGTIIPTSGWSLNIPEVPTGQFLWTRTIWTYTDNTNERGYSVSRMGLNGTNGNDGIAGKDGVGLKRTTIRYAASENGITPPVIWYADIPSVPPGQYLWTQTTWLYTDDTKETGYSISKIGEDGMKGDDGIAGKDGVGIESTNIQYTASSDGKNPPTTGWTDQIPIVTPGKFLWTRTVWTYTDGTNETGYSISKIGEDGTDGVAGKDGFGLKSTSIAYANSTSGTTPPSSGWSTNVPAVPAGNYLWTKTTWVYTDNTNETGYTVSRIGKDGNTGKDGIAGKDGVGISKTTITYAKSTNGTTAPTTGYTTTVPSTNPGDYLWTKTVWTYTDNTNETGYSVGKIGNTGAQGASATSYWITASNNIIGKSQTGVINPTNITFTGYSKTGTANSALYAGRFIIQTSTNGTSYTTRYTSSANQNAYTYTIPADTKFIKALFYQAGDTSVLLDEQTVPIVEGAEGIQIGGRNLFPQSGDFESRPSSFWVDNGGGLTFDDSITYNGYGTIKTYLGEGIAGSWLKLENGVEHTYSVLIRSEVPFEGSGNIPIHYHAGRNNTHQGKIMIVDYMTSYTSQDVGKFKKLWITFKLTSDADSFKPFLYWGVNRNVNIAYLKLEKGNVATDWTPAPEDARTYKAWANSSDGTVDFTRVYPNENLWIDSLSESGYESSGNVIPSTDTHRIMPELVPVDGTEIVYQVWNPNKVVNRSNSNRIAFLREDKTFISHITNILNGETYKSEPISLPSGTKYLRIGFIQGTPTDRDMAIKFKVEVGTTPTIYTTNTTDSLTGSMMKYIGFSSLDSNNPSKYQWIINPEYTKALSDEATNGALENINESLEDKVAREEYAKLEQLATEFAKSYEAFISEGGRYLEDAAALEDRFTQIFLELGANTLDLQFLNTYFRAGEEGLLIGSEDSQIKMLLTNNRLSFQEGVGANAKEIAYFGGQSFIINSGAIVQDFQIGEHKFTNIGGGRTVVQWVTK